MSIHQRHSIRIGCAGWNVPKAHADAFPADGSHLQRYAAVFDAVEINSSFYRPHRPQTYARWADAVAATFRFAVKLPRTITHGQRLVDSDALLDAFLAEVGGLRSKLGCVLVQLPPSLSFDAATANRFFARLRARHPGAVALEPRHATWFEAPADALLRRHAIARVAADPAPVAAAAEPGGDPTVAYFRLHGSPRMYYSDYDDDRLHAYAHRLQAAATVAAETWCFFDNTALGAATANAWAMRQLVAGGLHRGASAPHASRV
ncbi:MAG TPA: DUF72 domain-containing protein [Dokdonella sp.]